MDVVKSKKPPAAEQERKERQMADVKIMDAMEIEAKDVDMEGAQNVTIRWLISKADGAPNFAMRLFELGDGGHSPLHRHDWEHEVYILEGEGILVFEGTRTPFKEGYFIFVPPGREHCFVNTGKGRMRFLCIVPSD